MLDLVFFFAILLCLGIAVITFYLCYLNNSDVQLPVIWGSEVMGEANIYCKCVFYLISIQMRFASYFKENRSFLTEDVVDVNCSSDI